LQYHTEALEALCSRKDEELASKEGEMKRADSVKKPTNVNCRS